MSAKPIALIVGVGDGLSASLARLFHGNGYEIFLAARNVDKFSDLTSSTEAAAVPCDATNVEDVRNLFAKIEDRINNSSASGEGTEKSRLRVVVYNPSGRVRGPIDEVDPERVRKAIDVTAYGSFLVGQEASKIMLRQGREMESSGEDCGGGAGTIIFTGASAGVKGFAKSASFAMGKFAQRGLAESMARELHPQNVHVCWMNIDGPIRNPGFAEKSPDSAMDPNAIAQIYLNVAQQPRSTWTNEIPIRTWVERW